MIAAALVTALRARGVRALGFKPAETGIDSGCPPDSEVLALASGEENALARPLLQLPEPLAPAVAAERAGVTLDPDDIEARIRQLRQDGYAVVVEGAGGVMVPLSWGYTVLDLAQACDLDAVVVARAGLGTLNHVAMTVMMLALASHTDSGHCPERPERDAGPGRVDQPRQPEPNAPRRSHHRSPARPLGGARRRRRGHRHQASLSLKMHLSCSATAHAASPRFPWQKRLFPSPDHRCGMWSVP